MTCSILSSVAAVWLCATPEAKNLVTQANHAYQVGHFEEATALYEKAYDLSPSPMLLFNLGQCHRLQGNFERAAFYYQRYLSLAPAPIFNEANARQLLAECQQKLDEAAALADANRKAEAARQLAAAELARAAAAKRATDFEAARLLETQQATEALRQSQAEPLSRKWWLWTAMGVVAVGAGATVATVAVTSGGHHAATTLGDLSFK